MNITSIHRLKKQTIYLIFFYIFLLCLSPFPSVVEGHRVVLGICQSLSLGHMIYLTINLRKIVQKKFSPFLLFFALSFLATLIHVIFDTFYPVNITGTDHLHLTIDSFNAFLPHNIFRYLEGILLFIAFVLMLAINSSKKVRQDLIFTVTLILSITLTLSIEIIDIILEKEYGKNFQAFHLSLLFQAIYVSIVVFFVYKSLLKRVLVSGRIFLSYLFCCIALVAWASLVATTLLLDSFWIETPTLDNFHFLCSAFLVYVVILHVSKEESIEFLENSHFNRSGIYSFIGSFLLNRVLELLVQTHSVYYYISCIVTLIALGQRLLFIKDLDEHSHSQLQKIAHFDELTNLQNQKKFFIDMQSHINQSIPFTVILVNINRFKQINNLFTYAIGNNILIQFVNRIKETTEKIDSTMYRYSGDEFIIITHPKYKEEIIDLCKQIFSSLLVPFFIGNEWIKVSSNFGITSYPDDASTVNGLLKNLNAALKEAKALPLQSYKFYSLEMAADIEGKLTIEKDLHMSLENHEFELFYQPQYSISRELVGFEALIRWNHPTKGLVSPLEFIPIAEETGLIVLLGEWILSTACEQLAQWIEFYHSPLKISINISVRQLQQANFVKRVEEIIQKFQVPADLIVLEITETYPFYTEPDIVERIEKLQRIGCKISIDDFGTGFCSLTSLTKVPIDQIKIAREYIQTIGTNSKEEMLLGHLFSMLDTLSFEIVAEGVETAEQLREIEKTKCNCIQGFYFSKPLNQVSATSVFRESVATGKIRTF